MTHPIPLGQYRHYKGNLYEVVGFARHSETLEDMVIYQPLHGEGGAWVRPLSMWETPIEVDGEIVKRFVNTCVATKQANSATLHKRTMLCCPR